MAKAEAQKEDPEALAARRQIEQQREREKRARERAQLGGLWSRRDVFGRFGWGIFAAFSGVSLLAAVRSAFPRVLFQPPSTFKAGLPSDYTIGEVSEKFKKDQRVWIIRTEEGLYARSEEHTSELQSPCNLVCRLLLEKKKNDIQSPCTLVFHL